MSQSIENESGGIFMTRFPAKMWKQLHKYAVSPAFFCQYESNPNIQQDMIISEAKWDIWRRHLGLWELVVGFSFIQVYHLLPHKNKKYKKVNHRYFMKAQS